MTVCLRPVAFVLLLLVVPVGAGAVDFTLTDTEGKPHRLSDYKGKWVVVNFWATWCPPCLDELPELVNFHDKYAADTAVVLGINHEQVDLSYLRQFVDEYFISYPVLPNDPTITRAFGRIMGLPTTFIVSPKGEVVSRRVGGVTFDDLENVLRSGEVTVKAQFDHKQLGLD